MSGTWSSPTAPWSATATSWDEVGCKGAPDLIIEILSPSSLRHDRLTKYNLYARAGVREYWDRGPSAPFSPSCGGHYTAKDLGTPGMC